MDGKPAGMTANVPHGTIKFSRKEELCVAKIVAIANQKGGVGKTTTAVNLSSCVAALGKRVLIVDLDPQGNTTTGYGIPKRSVEKGTYEILIGEARASEAIRKTEYRTDVIGSNTRLAGASLEMIDLPARESRLRKALAEVQKDYDFIFIDCPPSLDLLTLNGLSACDSVLIPVQCCCAAVPCRRWSCRKKSRRGSTRPSWRNRTASWRSRFSTKGRQTAPSGSSCSIRATISAPP